MQLIDTFFELSHFLLTNKEVEKNVKRILEIDIENIED